MSASTGALEIRGPAIGLLDDPLTLRARGGGADGTLVWRGRLRDDDGRVWRAKALRAAELAARWAPSKPGAAPIAALQSLRPVLIDVHVEASDGRTATRTLTRLLVVDGVRLRRWRDELAATLCLPAGVPGASVLVDATAGPAEATVGALAGPLLAARGVLALIVTRGTIETAHDRLASVPGAGATHVVPAADPFAALPEPGDAVVLPPGVGAQDAGEGAVIARALAWDALLSRLGARPR